MARNPDKLLGERSGLLSVEIEQENFNAFVNKFLRESKKEADIVIKKIALDLLRRVIMKNPVKTGRARSGWYPALDGLGGKSPPGGEREGKYVEHLKGTLDKYVLLINNVKYIMYLEYGSSSQAPAGMVRVSLREMQGSLPKGIVDSYKAVWVKGTKTLKGVRKVR